KYSQVFEKLGGDKEGFLTDNEVVPMLKKSGLHRGTLATLWELSDQDKDGKLSRQVCQG
ncbi:unnamed protein product, partial [Choristocarpus tenellus]